MSETNKYLEEVLRSKTKCPSDTLMYLMQRYSGTSKPSKESNNARVENICGKCSSPHFSRPKLMRTKKMPLNNLDKNTKTPIKYTKVDTILRRCLACGHKSRLSLFDDVKEKEIQAQHNKTTDKKNRKLSSINNINKAAPNNNTKTGITKTIRSDTTFRTTSTVKKITSKNESLLQIKFGKNTKSNNQTKKIKNLAALKKALETSKKPQSSKSSLRSFLDSNLF